MAEIQSQVMKPIAAPSEPYVSLNLPKLAVYQENRAEAASHMIVAAALPHVRLPYGFRAGWAELKECPVS